MSLVQGTVLFAVQSTPAKPCEGRILFQNPDAWAIMGHVRYLQGDTEIAKDCYERTLSFVADASEIHSIYLRLASMYLQEERVSVPENRQIRYRVSRGRNRTLRTCLFCVCFFSQFCMLGLTFLFCHFSSKMPRTLSSWPVRGHHPACHGWVWALHATG